MQQKVVIFDFDGTIADSFAMCIEILNKLAEENGVSDVFGKDKTIEDLRNFSLKELILKVGIPMIMLVFIIRKWQQRVASSIKDLHTFPEMKKVLQSLKKTGFTLGIISSNSKQNIETFLKLNDLELFDFVYSENNLFGKSRTFNHCLTKMNLNANEVIYVGDETRDIEAAHQSGIKIIAVTWGFNSKKLLQTYHPDFLVDKPAQILNIVKKM